jgi:diguanylate cyclase (GGDEF)-like protein
MGDRLEMLEATLDLMDGGVAILDAQSNVLFWNAAAASLTGYPAHNLIAQPCPENLYRVDEAHQGRAAAGAPASRQHEPANAALQLNSPKAGHTERIALLEVPREDEVADGDALEQPTLVSMSHRLGHSVPAMLRKCVLCNPYGESIGTALVFYPVEKTDVLPHGECGDCADIERSQADMEDRLDAAHHQWMTSRMPFGLLWLTVDQAESLRRTHGRDACEAMLRTIERTLLRQLKPAEVIGRWGNNEFLILAHERSAELLVEHARRLAGLARTADFRWWGDRVGLTVSIGVSHASDGDTLQSLLNRARQAMQTSSYAGGNHVTEARETECSQS